MVAIIADEGYEQIGEKLKSKLLENNVDVDYISLENVNVKPCINCGGCIYKTYGKCVIRDDGDWIYPKLLSSDIQIYVTPITFGGYSFKTKRVLDKCALIMDRHYMVDNKELVKGGMLGKRFKMLLVGVSQDIMEDERKAFHKLFKEILIITRGRGKSYIIDSAEDLRILDNMVKEVNLI
jgi:multimeric flavodoxin WrbA